MTMPKAFAIPGPTAPCPADELAQAGCIQHISVGAASVFAVQFAFLLAGNNLLFTLSWDGFPGIQQGQRICSTTACVETRVFLIGRADLGLSTKDRAGITSCHQIFLKRPQGLNYIFP